MTTNIDNAASTQSATWFVGTENGIVECDNAALAGRIEDGAVDGLTLVWCPGMTDWVPLGELPQFKALLKSRVVTGQVSIAVPLHAREGVQESPLIDSAPSMLRPSPSIKVPSARALRDETFDDPTAVGDSVIGLMLVDASSCDDAIFDDQTAIAEAAPVQLEIHTPARNSSESALAPVASPMPTSVPVPSPLLGAPTGLKPLGPAANAMVPGLPNLGMTSLAPPHQPMFGIAELGQPLVSPKKSTPASVASAPPAKGISTPTVLKVATASNTAVKVASVPPAVKETAAPAAQKALSVSMAATSKSASVPPAVKVASVPEAPKAPSAAPRSAVPALTVPTSTAVKVASVPEAPKAPSATPRSAVPTSTAVKVASVQPAAKDTAARVVPNLIPVLAAAQEEPTTQYVAPLPPVVQEEPTTDYVAPLPTVVREEPTTRFIAPVTLMQRARTSVVDGELHREPGRTKPPPPVRRQSIPAPEPGAVSTASSPSPTQSKPAAAPRRESGPTPPEPPRPAASLSSSTSPRAAVDVGASAAPPPNRELAPARRESQLPSAPPRVAPTFGRGMLPEPPPRSIERAFVAGTSIAPLVTALAPQPPSSMQTAARPAVPGTSIAPQPPSSMQTAARPAVPGTSIAPVATAPEPLPSAAKSPPTYGSTPRPYEWAVGARPVAASDLPLSSLRPAVASIYPDMNPWYRSRRAKGIASKVTAAVATIGLAIWIAMPQPDHAAPPVVSVENPPAHVAASPVAVASSASVVKSDVSAGSVNGSVTASTVQKVAPGATANSPANHQAKVVSSHARRRASAAARATQPVAPSEAPSNSEPQRPTSSEGEPAQRTPHEKNDDSAAAAAAKADPPKAQPAPAADEAKADDRSWMNPGF